MLQTKIALRSDLAGEYKTYAKEAGMTLEKAVNDALDKWMDETGRFVYAELVKRHTGRKQATKISERKAS